MPDVDVKPTIFISHKHADAKIAQVLAAFCEKKAGGRVRVFLSSDPDFKGPRMGKNLNTELRRTLWDTDVLLLVYTSASDYDWSYCMWECGVAGHSQSPETNLIVFQCGTDSPPILNEATRIKPRDDKQIKGFVNSFLRSGDFFPSLNGKPLLTDYKDNYIADDSKELFDAFGAVLPKNGGASEEWPTWPYLRIELPQGDVEKLQQASEAERVSLSHQVVKEFGVVIDSDSRAAQLFGLQTFPPKMKLDALLKTWKDKNPSLEPTWFDSCCEQILMGAGRGFPVIRWTPLREADGDAEYTPVLSRIKSKPYSGTVQFDIYFYNLSDPRAIPVTSKMMPLNELFYKQIGKIDPEVLKLTELIGELELRQRNRVPILSNESHPMYMVHRSMIDKFIVKTVMAPGGAEKVASLTLANLLSDEEMRPIFENTFVVVKRQATLAEALSAMVTRPNCSDVFVTVGGTSNEPVQGWLTNVDMARSA
jgi:TIR domain-containing protein